MEAYQCCYTHARRVSGGTVSAGWEAVAISPEAPQEAVRTCKRFQNASCPTRPGLVDEDGRVLEVLDIAGDGSYLYVIRTRYGMTDTLGRPSMFSHGFLFPLKGTQVLQDPNVFLALDRENFKTSEEEASQWDGQLRRSAPLDLKTAMETAGLENRDSYAALVKCVYAQMSEGKNPRPLYVWYNGEEDQLRALLYCIYAAVPYSMRRNLSAVSSANAVNLKRNLIFTRNAREKDRYLIPQTGENNLLSPRLERKIARYGYLDHAASALPPEDFPQFFQDLEDTAARFGDSANELVLKLAYQYLSHGWDASNLSEEDLEGNLSAALRCPPSAALEDGIAAMLDEINRRDLRLSRETEASLEKRLGSTGHEALKQAGLSYQVRKDCQLPEGEAARRLREIPEELFPLYRKQLAASARGQGILEAYYRSVLREEPVSWASLERMWNLSEEDAAREAVRQEALALYQQEAREKGASALEAYAALLEKLTPDTAADSVRQAKERFWAELDFQDFAFGGWGRYAPFRVNTPRCHLFQACSELYGRAGTISGGMLLQEAAQCFDGRHRSGEPDRTAALEALCSAVRQKDGVPPALPDWIRMAAAASSDELVKRVRRLYEVTARFQGSQLSQEYPKFWNACAHAQNTEGLQKTMSRLVEDACRAYDTPEHPVPLDVWLRIGERRPGNCFAALEEFDAAILSTDPYQAIRGSDLMRQVPYREAAHIYLTKQGGKTRTARWLERGRTPESGKSGPSPEEGFFLRRLLPFLDRGGSEAKRKRE